MVESEGLECCVCYGPTDVRTPCGHLLCVACRLLLPQPSCPLCRQELQPLQGQIRPHRASRPVRQRSARGYRPPRAGQLSSNIGAEAVETASERILSESRRAASERPERRINAGFSPRSPFAAWLHNREIGATGVSSRQAQQTLVEAQFVPQSSLVSSARAMFVGRDASPRNSPNRDLGYSNLSITQLVPRIGRMSLAEVPRFVQHVAWLSENQLVDSGRSALLKQVLSRRAADLFSVVPLQSLGNAGDILASLEEAVEPHCNSLRKALEARLSYLLYHPGDDTDTSYPFDHLVQVHTVATSLTQRHLISALPLETCRAHLKRWFGKATVLELTDQASAISALCCSDQLVFDVVSKRLLALLRHLLSIEKLDRLVRVLLTLECNDLPIWSRELQRAVLDQIRAGFDIWKPARIQECLSMSGGLRQFCVERPGVADEVKPLLAARVVKAVMETSLSLKRSTELHQVQAEFSAWSQLAKCAIAAGILDFDRTSCNAIVDAVARCTTRCMESTEFQDSMMEVRNLEWTMLTVIACGRSDHIGDR